MQSTTHHFCLAVEAIRGIACSALLGTALMVAVGASALVYARDGAEDEEIPDRIRVPAPPVIEANQTDRFGFDSTLVTAAQIEDLNAMDLAAALRRTPGVAISRYNPIGAFGCAEGGASRTGCRANHRRNAVYFAFRPDRLFRRTYFSHHLALRRPERGTPAWRLALGAVNWCALLSPQ